jgi:cell division protein FtsL
MKAVPLHKMALWILGLVLALVVVWERVYTGETAWRVEMLRKKQKLMETELNYLKLQVEELADMERIEALALYELSMKYPDAGQVFWVERDSEERD